MLAPSRSASILPSPLVSVRPLTCAKPVASLSPGSGVQGRYYLSRRFQGQPIANDFVGYRLFDAYAAYDHRLPLEPARQIIAALHARAEASAGIVDAQVEPVGRAYSTSCASRSTSRAWR
jgi:hypothetical protein